MIAGTFVILVGVAAVGLAFLPPAARKHFGAAGPKVQSAWGAVLIVAGLVVIVMN